MIVLTFTQGRLIPLQELFRGFLKIQRGKSIFSSVIVVISGTVRKDRLEKTCFQFFFSGMCLDSSYFCSCLPEQGFVGVDWNQMFSQG